MSRPGLLSGGEEGDGWKEHLSMLGQIQTKLRRCAIGIGDVVVSLGDGLLCVLLLHYIRRLEHTVSLVHMHIHIDYDKLLIHIIVL